MIRRRALLAAALATPAAIARAQSATKLSFYYPIAVGGPIPAIVDGYCADFKEQTGIEVTPVYAGNYGETLTKAVTAIRGGSGPQLAVLLAAEMHSLQDMDILTSIDELGIDPAGMKAWTDGFYPAFLANSHAEGKLWSVPFQRSTAIMYYNKDAFAEAGLDPETFPRTWAELEAAAAKLTKRDTSGRVMRWGVKMAGDVGNAQWTFGALANQAGHVLMNEAGTETWFNHPKAIEAMTYLARPVGDPQGDAGRRVELAAIVARFPGRQRRDHSAHHRQSHEFADQREVSFRRRGLAGQGRPSHRGGRRQHLFLPPRQP